MMSSAGTTKAVMKFHLRHFILRANISAKINAEWANKLQSLCESDGLGIPAIVASNPRNHITKGVLNDLLRNELGFKGIINSDTGPIEMMPWGAGDLSIKERYKKTLEAGINIYGSSPYLVGLR